MLPLPPELLCILFSHPHCTPDLLAELSPQLGIRSPATAKVHNCDQFGHSPFSCFLSFYLHTKFLFVVHNKVWRSVSDLNMVRRQGCLGKALAYSLMWNKLLSSGLLCDGNLMVTRLMMVVTQIMDAGNLNDKIQSGRRLLRESYISNLSALSISKAMRKFYWFFWSFSVQFQIN